MSLYTAKDMADSFRTVRKNTVIVAEDIPAEKYGFRAAEGTMSVGEMLAHLAAATYWSEQLHWVEKLTAITLEDFGRYMAENKAIAATLVSKDDIVHALKNRGESFARMVEDLGDEGLAVRVAFPPPVQPASRTRFEMLLAAKEHEMHHRGQLMLIERMIGIVPHLTRARQR